MSAMSVSRLKDSRQSSRTRSVYNPVGFDPIEVLPVRLHRYADHARYFLHFLYAQRVFKDVKEDFVSLKAAYLRRFFPDNTIYKQIRDALLDSETIICDVVYYQADSPRWKNHYQQRRYGKSLGYLCEEERFYGELILLDDTQTDRETFKKHVFTQVFYGKNC
jgi:hypothetical protein